MSRYLIVKRLNTEQKVMVKQMAAASFYLCQILFIIYQNDLSSMVIFKTVYNTLQSIHQEKLDSYIPVQALFDKLQGSDFEF
ncbi:31617_t:CDS:1, partial [Racocetra persica]